MPLRRDRAIVLRSYRVGEADKVVVFLARTLGKLRGMAKGARRPRSRHGAGLEIGTELELTFFEKEGRELVSVDRCDIVRSRFSELSEPVVASTLGYLLDLVDAFAPDREPNVRLYRLLRALLDSLSALETSNGASPADADAGAAVLSLEAKTRYFEAWLLRLGGTYPRRKTCPTCGRALEEEGARFVIEDYAIGCPSCFERGTPLSKETLGFLDQVWKKSPIELDRPDRAEVLRELGALHYQLIQQQLEKELRSRQVLEDLLRAERRE